MHDLDTICRLNNQAAEKELYGTRPRYRQETTILCNAGSEEKSVSVRSIPCWPTIDSLQKESKKVDRLLFAFGLVSMFLAVILAVYFRSTI